MIVRLEHRTGQVEATIPTPDELTPQEIAEGLLTVLPGVTRVRLWADGLSFLDVPTADVPRGDAVPAPRSEKIIDVATTVLLTQIDPKNPPEWLRPYSGPGARLASGSLPPV